MHASVKTWLTLALKVGVSLGLLWWLTHSIDLTAVRHALAHLRASSLVIALSLIVLQAVVLGWRWHRIVAWLGGSLPPVQAVHWVFVGLFFNQALPSSVGGDAVRMWLLRRRGAPLGLAFGSVAIERGTGVAMLGLMISCCVPLMTVPVGDRSLALPLLAAGPCLLVVLGLLAVLDKPIAAHLPKSLGSSLSGLGSGLREIARSPLAVVEVAVLGIVASLLSALAAWILGRDLGIVAGPLAYVVLVGGAVLLSVLPVSLGGWGLREAAMVTLFASIGAAREPVLAMSVIWGLLPLVVSLPFGLLWWAARSHRGEMHA